MLALALAGTLLLWDDSRKDDGNLLAAEFSSIIGEFQGRLDDRVAGYTQVLRGAAALFAAADGKVSRTAWHDYISGLDLSVHYPALPAVAFARAFSDAELDSFVAEMRASGLSDFSVRPPGRRERYVVNAYTEPYAGLNVKALGYDMWQDADRRETMEHSRLSGKPMITGKLTLRIDEATNPVPAFIMYYPVFIKGTEEVGGYVLSPFRMPALMADLLGGNGKYVSVAVYDGKEAVESALFYRSHADHDMEKARQSSRHSIEIGGRSWTLEFASRPMLEARVYSSRSPLILGVGAAMTILLTAITWSLTATRERAFALAAGMTTSLRMSERRFRELAENIDQVFFVAEPDYSAFHYISPAFERMWGRSAAALRADPGIWAKWLHPDDREMVAELVAAGRLRDHYQAEFRILRPDGDIRWVSAHAFNLPASEEEKARVVGFHADITARKRAEADLAATHDHLNAAIESIDEGLALYDASDRLILCNRAYSRDGADFISLVPGISYEELIRKAYRHGFYGKYESGEEGFVSMRMELHRTYRPFEFKAPDGRWLLNVSYPVKDGGTAVLRIDMTERKRAEERIAAYTAEIERSNAELEQFAYIASHDLREPLRMVSSYLSLIALRYGDALSETGLELLEFARDGATRMDRMVADLLEYARIGRREVEMKPVPAGEVLGQTLRTLCPDLRDCDADITIEDGLKDAMVLGDKGLLFSLFQNIIGNALKYRSPERPCEIRIACRREGEYWELTVADNGIGVEPEHYEKIFGIFQRLHAQDQYEGTGIGLAVSRKIVDRLGGRIWLESEPGRGAAFHIALQAA